MSSNSAADKMGPRASTASREEQDYVRGFEEGTRSALMEVLSYISKGHTASEIRFMAETRLAHLRGELEERRQAILRVPPSLPKSTLMPGTGRSSEKGERTLPTPMAGYSYLFLEENHTQARHFIGQLLDQGLPVVAITRQPQDLPEPKDPHHLLTLVVDSRGNDEWKGEELSGRHSVGADSSAITGVINRFLEGSGPQVVCYWECFEYFVNERTYEQSLKLVHWLNSTVLSKKGILVLSVDPETMSATQLRNLRVDFNHCLE